MEYAAEGIFRGKNGVFKPRSFVTNQRPGRRHHLVAQISFSKRVFLSEAKSAAYLRT